MNSGNYNDWGINSSQGRLKVYALEDGRFLTTVAAAYFMGLVDLEHFNEDNAKDELAKYYEVTSSQLEMLTKAGIKIDVQKVSKTEQRELEISTKPTIKVYLGDNEEVSIDIETAYYLELIDDRAYENSDSKYYKLTSQLFNHIVSKYDVEQIDLKQLSTAKKH